jgi:predicted RNA polymerase sigma factor
LTGETRRELTENALLVLERWSADGIAHHPSVRMTAAVRRKVSDGLRRKDMLIRKQVLLLALLEQEEGQGKRKANRSARP